MKNKGFTLIELLVTIAIISLLASIVFASVSNARTKATETKNIVQGKEIGKALELSLLSNTFSNIPISQEQHETHIQNGTNTMAYKPYDSLLSGGIAEVDVAQYGEPVANVSNVSTSKSVTTNEESPYRILYPTEELLNDGANPSDTMELVCLNVFDLAKMSASDVWNNLETPDYLVYAPKREVMEYWTDNYSENMRSINHLMLVRKDTGNNIYTSGYEQYTSNGDFVHTNLPFLGLEEQEYDFIQEGETYQTGRVRTLNDIYLDFTIDGNNTSIRSLYSINFSDNTSTFLECY